MTETIYHICRQDEWDQARAQGLYHGSSQDKADGFIHFSAAAQLRTSAARHRAGQDGLVVLAVATQALHRCAQRLGDRGLVWEKSRGGALFPHYYGAFDPSAVVRLAPLALVQGGHVFPAWFDADNPDPVW